MNDWLHVLAPILASGGSLLALATAILSYRSHVKLVNLARSKTPSNDAPIIEDESEDPSFKGSDEGDMKDRDDE